MDEWAYGVTLSSGGGVCPLFSYIHKRQTQRQQSLYHTCFLGGCCEGSAQEATQPPTSRNLPAPKRPNRCTEGPKRHQLPVLSRRGHVDRQCSRSSSSQAVPEHQKCTKCAHFVLLEHRKCTKYGRVPALRTCAAPFPPEMTLEQNAGWQHTQCRPQRVADR